MMIIWLKRLTIFLIIISFLISGCISSDTKHNYRNKYVIDVYYNPDGFSIFGSQKLLYKNTEDTELEKLYFHLYANAFRDEKTAPMIGTLNENYPGGFNTGQIDIIGVWVEDIPVNWSISGESNTILEVQLSKKLKVNEKTDIRIDFQEKLPNAKTDFGSYNGIACFENWYPILCVYDSSGWNIDSYTKFGEPNFSEVSDYCVNINLPSTEIVASTGECVREKDIGNGRKQITLKAENVRDFTWFSSSRFKMVEKEHNGVTIKSYFIDKDKVKGVAALDICVRALNFYTETFGEYPYKSLSVAETYLYGGAMEYPMLVSIGEEYYTSNDDELIEMAIAHELAHQWWYVVVGNNEYREPWLDEAMAEYSEALYAERYYGKEMLIKKVNSHIGLASYDSYPGDDMGKFSTQNEYYSVVYKKGGRILHELRLNIGDEKFFEIIKCYYDTYKFNNADIDGFLQIVNNICGSEAVEFLSIRLSGIK